MRRWRDRRGKGSEPEPYTVRSVDVGGTSQGDWAGTARGLGGSGGLGVPGVRL